MCLVGFWKGLGHVFSFEAGPFYSWLSDATMLVSCQMSMRASFGKRAGISGSENCAGSKHLFQQ